MANQTAGDEETLSPLDLRRATDSHEAAGLWWGGFIVKKLRPTSEKDRTELEARAVRFAAALTELSRGKDLFGIGTPDGPDPNIVDAAAKMGLRQPVIDRLLPAEIGTVNFGDTVKGRDGENSKVHQIWPLSDSSSN